MKKCLVIAFLSVFFIIGCTREVEQPEMTCQEYCETQPHIMCVGHWNISGTYPDCNCEWVCETPETNETVTSDAEEDEVMSGINESLLEDEEDINIGTVI